MISNPAGRKKNNTINQKIFIEKIILELYDTEYAKVLASYLSNIALRS